MKWMKDWRRLCGGVLACLLLLALCACGEKQEMQETQEQTFRAAELGLTGGEDFTYPYLGMRLTLPESLARRMSEGEVFCQTMENVDGTSIMFALLWWDEIPEELRDASFAPEDGDGLRDWVLSLERVGTVGVYRSDIVEQIGSLTGCDSHVILAENGDYQYILSLREEGNAGAAEELRQIVFEQLEMTPLPDGMSPFDEVRETVSALGAFETQDIYGETVTPEIFEGYSLTLVNLFTTWCQPCLREIPELDQLREQMAEKGVNVIGIVLDAADGTGTAIPETVALAQQIQSRTGVQYPFLLPDATQMNGRLTGVTAVPETFFVDSQGNIVGDTYVGARDLAAWTEIVEAELAALKNGE